MDEETRVAVLSIIVEDNGSVPALNELLHDCADVIIGRMGLPYRERDVSLICIAMDAPMDRINALSGALGRLPGVTAKAAVSNV